MRHYCTLYDYKYVPKAAAMYHSLSKHSSEPFTLHALALDPLAENASWTPDFQSVPENTGTLKVYNLGMVHAELYGLKGAMPHRDFCWMMASYFLHWIINRPGIFEATYVDADLFFFNDPSEIHWMGHRKDVMIVPHDFAPENERFLVNGKYNVSWVRANRNAEGLIRYWKERCIEKCDAESCGDQKYLDEWEMLMGDRIFFQTRKGVGTAPWNISKFKVESGPRVDDFPVLFYHFHEHHRIGKERTGYPLRPEDIKYIYEPYEAVLEPLEAKFK